jgi:ABC-type transporter Mla subunit MlaD
MLEDYYEFETDEERLKFGQMVSILMEFVISREEDEALRDLSYEQHRERLERRVKEGLRLKLAQSGITGIAYIEADVLDPEKNPPMEIIHTPRHIYIPSAPSTIATLTGAATRFAAKLNDVDVVQLAGNLDTLIVELTDAVRDAKVDRLEEEAVGLLSELRETNRQLQTTLAKADVPAVTASASEAMQEATATLVRAQRMLDGGRYDLEAALENARVASENLRDLTETLKAQPSLLVRGDPPKQIEVEVGQ